MHYAVPDIFYLKNLLKTLAVPLLCVQDSTGILFVIQLQMGYTKAKRFLPYSVCVVCLPAAQDSTGILFIMNKPYFGCPLTPAAQDSTGILFIQAELDVTRPETFDDPKVWEGVTQVWTGVRAVWEVMKKANMLSAYISATRFEAGLQRPQSVGGLHTDVKRGEGKGTCGPSLHQ